MKLYGIKQPLIAGAMFLAFFFLIFLPFVAS